MRLVLLLFLLASQAESPASAAPQGPGASYQSEKSLAAIQKCLTDKLTRIGDVTDVTIDGTTTLMLREGLNEQAMLIDLAPRSVTVTTPFLHGTRKLVEACL